MCTHCASTSSAAQDPIEKLTLEQVVSKGLKNNIDLLAAEYDVAIARAEGLTAGLWNNPTMSYYGSLLPFGKAWNQTNAGGPSQHDLMFYYPIDLSGKILKSGRVAAMATRESEADFKNQVRLKTLEIRLAALQLIGQHEELLLAAQNPSEFETKKKQAAYAQTKIHLGNLMGRYPSAMNFEVTSSLDAFHPPAHLNLKELHQLAISQRPDLQTARLAKERGTLTQSYARARILNDINFGMGISRQETVNPDPSDSASASFPTAYSWAVNVVIPLPIFNRSQGHIARAEAQEAQAVKRTESLTLAIQEEIEILTSQLELNALRTHTREFLATRSAPAHSKLPHEREARTQSIAALVEYRQNLARLNAAIGQDIIAP